MTLTSAAPAGGAVVTLASNGNAATVPVSVTVAAGATTKTFVVNTSGAVTVPTVVTLTATYSGVVKTATLTVNPPVGSSGRRKRQSNGSDGSRRIAPAPSRSVPRRRRAVPLSR